MKKIISLIILLSFILTSCSSKTEEAKTENETTNKYVKTEKIQKKNFVENLKLVGKIGSQEETTISPLTSGNIKTINVKVGDKVHAGDILATIDTQSNLTNISLSNAEKEYNNTLTVYNSTKEYLEKNLETTKLQYENAKKTRDNTYSSTEKQLQSAQADLDSITLQKTNTSKSNETSINIAQESLSDAELSLSNFEKNAEETMKNLETQKITSLDNIRIAIDNSMATFDSSIIYIDTILGVTDTNKELNDNYENYLSAKNTTLKTQAEKKFNDVYNDYTKIKGMYSNTSNLSEDELLNYYSKIISLNDKLITLFDNMTSVLDNSVTSSSLTDSTLSSFKTTIKSYQSQVISLKSTLISGKNSLINANNNIDSTTTSNGTQKASLEQAVKTAQLNLENTKASTQTSNDNLSSSEKTTKLQLESTIESIKSSRDSADNSVAVAKSQYESALANYNSSLASTKSQLDSAAGSKNTYAQQLNNALIKAPIDGTIISKNIDIGTSVSSATQSFSISNSSKKIIKLDVTSDNVKYFKVGQSVKIGKNDKTATGTINIVGESTDETTGMYKVEITFNDKNFNDYLSLGDYVDVYIQKGVSNEKYLIVPFSSLIVGSNETYSVYLVGDDNKVQEKEVTIGDSNSTEVIITNGLKEGDRVVVEGTLSISAGDEVQEM